MAWLEALPLYHLTGDYLFVHAGILPGTPIEQPSERDLLWIRCRFLAGEEDHGRLVIPGHNPMEPPAYLPTRTGVDTHALPPRTLSRVRHLRASSALAACP